MELLAAVDKERDWLLVDARKKRGAVSWFRAGEAASGEEEEEEEEKLKGQKQTTGCSSRMTELRESLLSWCWR